MPGKPTRTPATVCTDETCRGKSGTPGATPSGCHCHESVQLAAVLVSTLDPLVIIDSFGVILSASNSVERVFGWHPKELVGRNVGVLMPEPHRSSHDRYLLTYRETLKTNILGRTREFEAERRDGSRFPIELAVARADVPGQDLPVFVGVIRDISERQAREHEREEHRAQLEERVLERTHELEKTHEQLRLADRLAAIGTLAAGLGHDMNNVLLPMRGRMNALQGPNLTPTAREHLASLKKSCDYLQQLSDGLHMLALNPDGESPDEITDLFNWWSTVGVLLSRAVPKSIRCRSEIPKGLPRVRVAPHRLTQAVLNLIVNAGEAIHSISRRRRIGLIRIWAHEAPGGRTVHLGVTDDGPGMSKEVQARAFDAFFTTKKRGLGTGLGLSLVRNVVMSVGGEVDLSTAPGKGAEVVLTLPIAPGINETSSAGADKRAVVSMQDRRAGSMATHILEASGWVVTQTPSVSRNAVVWVTEPTDNTASALDAFLSRPGRAVVVLGKFRGRTKSPKQPTPNLISLSNPHDFDALRNAIGDAMRLAMEQRRPSARVRARRSRLRAPRNRSQGRL